ncbi:TetR/AcrR family transcriptional regulator [Kitasatospora sp. CM 4170]|uniref:TetR/AcrR family transcriptional regulator n=1 Tax=Kitasatospora aburaviensis TaxID=67265 RepID=A0ABW1F0L0_9ACTN|nr:TetR/AcrR family transcriptional regulator [Kitasatospora sp. CM 4170]WNM49306.1 TetR/AcrR family transcriptional regulator [Kitasatospora sp. CM 4170]
MPAKSPTGAFARAQARGESALRTAMLDIAAELLATEGPAALSMRRLAAAADCSTTVLYRLFGAKEGIAAALYREGFARLHRRLEEVPRDDDPAAYLAAVGRAYRAGAVEQPNFYSVMHGEGIPGFVPDEASRAVATASLDVLREAARACIEAGVFRADADADEVADTLWAAAHGVISLERGGHFPGALGEQRYRTLTAAAAAAFLA